VLCASTLPTFSPYGQPLPPAVVTDTAHLATANAAWAEPLETVLVQVEDATVTAVCNGYSEWKIRDASGVDALVDDAGYHYCPPLNQVLEVVTGTLWYTYDDYRLEPRSAADIVVFDDVPPSVVATVPAPGATGVSPYEPLAATFGEPIAEATLDWTLSGPGGPVTGTVSCDAATAQATFRPDDFLTPNSGHNVVGPSADRNGGVVPAQWADRAARPARQRVYPLATRWKALTGLWRGSPQGACTS
jgi:hypothetical protein